MINFVLDLIYPKKCIMCSDIIIKGNINICGECFKKILYNDRKSCLFCGKDFKNCKCQNEEKLFVFSAFKYTDVIKDGIQSFKFSNKPQNGKVWALLLYNYVRELIKDANVDYITYVPMHKEKESIRGYNQGEILAGYLAKLTNIPMKKILVKEKKHMQLHNLSKSDRTKAIKNSFAIKKNVNINNKNILIVDDVFTTGSTLLECRKTLAKGNIKKIMGIVVANAGVEKTIDI